MVGLNVKNEILKVTNHIIYGFIITYYLTKTRTCN